jgi:formylglycine-generating enzyme required for sulfatase activity
MGSPKDEKGRKDDEDQHEVEITRPFYMGACEVTQEEYVKVTGKNPSHFSGTGGGKFKVKGLDTRRFPVEDVSWDQATAFCKKLSELPEEKKSGRYYRLPTEAEWEYACRGGATSPFPFHFGDSLAPSQANYDGRLKRTSAVASYGPNAFGLYDMHGNVWEWCADWYDRNYYKNSPVKDPAGPAAGGRRVLRGGSSDDPALTCRSAVRDYFSPAYHKYTIGFRVVCVTGPPDGGGGEKPPAGSLRLLPPEPVTLGPGQSKAVTLRVERRNCPGAVEVKLVGGPAGVSASDGLVRNEKDEGTVTIRAAAGTKPGSHTLRLRAVAAAASAEGELRLTITEVRSSKEYRNSMGMIFVRIEPGTFLMGSPDGTTPAGMPREPYRDKDETPHRVTLTRGYHLGAYLVTQEQWEQVMGKAANRSWFKGKDDEEKKKLPVDNVTWFDCVEFCIKLSEKEQRKPRYRLTGVERNADGSIKAATVELLAGGTGYRLPTEAEWEYACRAGTGTPFWWGNSITTDQANYDGTSTYGRDGKKGEYRNKTTPVDQFKANPWGLHDMHGNLWQWCQDWYGEYPKDDIKDPQGSNSGPARVLRGGSWFEAPWNCRAAYRGRVAPSRRLCRYFGCRLLLRLD